MARISARITEELLAAADKARGDIPREVWLRRAIEEKIAREPFVASMMETFADAGETLGVTHETLRRIGVDPDSLGEPEPPPLPARLRVRSSAQAKAGRGPIPKKGK
jgi:hypothetical protein